MESAVAAGSFPFAVPDYHCLPCISEGADFRSPAVYLSVENRNEFGYNLPVPGGFSGSIGQMNKFPFEINRPGGCMRNLRREAVKGADIPLSRVQARARRLTSSCRHCAAPFCSKIRKNLRRDVFFCCRYYGTAELGRKSPENSELIYQKQ